MEAQKKMPGLAEATTYAEIKDRVEKNLHEGYGVPYEVLILMARTLDAQQKELEKQGAALADAQARLPLEDAVQANRRKQEQLAQEAALRVTDELVVHKRRMMGEFEHASQDDMELLFGHAGQSFYDFMG